MKSLSIFFLFSFNILFSNQEFTQISQLQSNESSFGSSVALSGHFLLIGNPNATVMNNSGQGNVYTYKEVAFNSSSNQQILTAVNGAVNDYFGSSIATDGNFAVIGAPSTILNSGKAYIFTRSKNSEWIQSQELVANDTGVYQFGTSVSLEGGVISIGCFATIGTNSQQGSVYVYSYVNPEWIQTYILTASDGAAGDKFGFSVSNYGNFIVAGAPFHTVGTNSNQGSVYLFQLNGTMWNQIQILTANDGTDNTFFGISVSIYYPYLIVGSDGDNSNQGAAYIFFLSDGIWSQQQKLTATDGTYNDQFGKSVLIFGLNAFVGAPSKVINSCQGVAYSFYWDGNQWIQTQELFSSIPLQVSFGNSISFSGTTLVIGSESGLLSIFSGLNSVQTTLIQNQTINPPINSVELGAILGSIFGFLFLIVIGIILIYFFRKKQQKRKLEVDIPVLPSLSIPLNYEEEESIYESIGHQHYALFNKKLGNEIKYSELKLDNPYKIIGKGGFGIVYKGSYKGEDVAIKEINGNIVNPHEIDAFLQEAALMDSIETHPNIIKLIGIVADPFCIVVEFMPNGDLHHYLKKQDTINPSQEVKWMIEICNGMAHLAANNIIHKDLAARNCLLDKDLVIKISDFGLARITDDSKVIYSRSNIGPVKWMSIEALSKKKFSEKSDVWSFGITCIEILTRRDPYPGVSAVQVSTLIALENLRPGIPENITINLKDILESCWKTQPEDRPTFKELLIQLNSISNEIV